MFPNTHPRRPILSTPAESATERTARHLHHLRRLAELGMELAEAAATRARTALAEPPQTSEPNPEEEEPPQPPRGPHPATLFAQLASVVRQAITLECRVVAGHAATIAPHTQADPRRAKIRLAIRQATEGRFNRIEIRQQADDLLDTELALDPDGAASLPDLLDIICQDLNFRLDYETLAADLAANLEQDANSPDWPPQTDPPRPPH